MDTYPTLPQDLWDQTPPEVRAYIETLAGQVQTLTSMIHMLQEQVRALQEQVTQTSRNSSRRLCTSSLRCAVKHNGEM
jgi:hypothetical protein